MLLIGGTMPLEDLIQSFNSIQSCRQKGIESERLFGKREWELV